MILAELSENAGFAGTFVIPTKKPWQSQTELIAVLGTTASFAQMFGYVALTPEQIGMIGAGLFTLIGLVRTWSNGEKIVLKKQA